MSDNLYHLQIQKLCDMLHLGTMIQAPEAISGGFLHRMYSISTTQGKYAIKALNPQIMRRPAAMHNFIRSERIATMAASHILALPAIQSNGSAIHEIDNQFFLVFHWMEGKSLKPSGVTGLHCEKIGSILADIHLTDFSALCLTQEESHTTLINWDDYSQQGQENNAVWAKQLLHIKDSLYEWNAGANHSAQFLASNRIFIHSYKKKVGAIQADWRKVLEHGFISKLGWLEYSLKRSLRLECSDEEEQQMGTLQVTATINAIIRYAEMIPQVESWLHQDSAAIIHESNQSS
ncbi:phosphotransferase [Paenibacillus terrigena]|uniref:phosphotransferase n=1 Tax=Paenibacillus terrigena TaxID=369333 RepID=UPI0028D07D0C|nr:phosphotransferase [Paenibacillus terrigena]